MDHSCPNNSIIRLVQDLGGTAWALVLTAWFVLLPHHGDAKGTQWIVGYGSLTKGDTRPLENENTFTDAYPCFFGFLLD
jgi:hypothetical protein